MRNWSIGRWLVAGFATIIAFGLGFGLVALNSMSTLRVKSSRSADRQAGALAIGEIRSLITRNCGRAEELLSATGDQRTKIADDIATASPAIDGAFHDYEATIREGEDRTQFDALKADRAEFDKAVQAVVDSSVAGRREEAVSKAMETLAPIATKILDEDITRLIELEHRNAEARLTELNTAADSARTAAVAAMAFDLAAIAAIGWFLVRGINRSLTLVASCLTAGANQIAYAAGQISHGSQTLAEGANEQAASIEETSSSMEQMSSMTRKNAENAHLANDIAKQTRSAADKGAADMATMSAAMEAIRTSSDDIAKIIKTIDEIAFQTNILALNAAVEAARAGEAGMGFAVVADEVRNLAQRSAEAAKETASKIEGAIAKSGQGVEMSGKAARTLNEIVAKVRRMDELVAEVAAASREQTDGITQINLAISQMEKVTHGNSVHAESSAASAEELKTQAETMRDSIGELLSLAGARAESSVGDPHLPPVVDETAAKKPPAAARPQSKEPAKGLARPAAPRKRPTPESIVSRRSEIPLDGDFKDF